MPATGSGPKVLHRARIDELRTAARCSQFAEAQRRFGTRPTIRVPIASVDCRRKHLETCRSVRPLGAERKRDPPALDGRRLLVERRRAHRWFCLGAMARHGMVSPKAQV